MKYHELLSQYIEKSGLSLGEISLKLSNRGIDISRSYVSKLKTGSKPPASDELNKALSEVTGGDPVKLIIAGYLEKAPDEFIESMKIVEEQNRKTDEEIKKAYKQRGEYITSDKYKEHVGSVAEQLLLYNYKTIDPQNILKVPILGYIAAGKPILAEDQIEDWLEIPNIYGLEEGKSFILIVKGDSMIGSRIHEGDKVLVKMQPEVESGEIAVVNVNGSEATLKRVKKTDSGQVILYPDNPKYDPIFLTDTSARIVGKVIQVMFEP